METANFAAILQELGVSVLVTTYQAGKLVMLRPKGERLNTHFRGFSKPMGLAVDGDRSGQTPPCGSIAHDSEKTVAVVTMPELHFQILSWRGQV
jgi:hypothetical protein